MGAGLRVFRGNLCSARATAPEGQPGALDVEQVHLALAGLWSHVLSTARCVEADNLGVKASGVSPWKEQADATCCVTMVTWALV